VQCGRKGLCFFSEGSFVTGKCLDLFSIENDSELSTFNSFMDSQLRAPTRLSRFLCKSLNIDAAGKCVKGLTSAEKNKPCTSDLDCAAKENPKVLAKCRCALSGQGRSFCDLHAGDDEWLQANKAVRRADQFARYFNATLACHSSQRWGECDQKELFFDW